MRKTVFWSWQSDLPPDVTKDFIKGALSQALKRAASELELESADRIELDHDTKGEAGMVEIVATIFNKIDDCEVFVADITPVASIQSKTRDKKIPNPNVLIELGYAMREVGHKRVIAVSNLAFGGEHEELPFDLRHRRGAITYTLASTNDPSLAKTRNRLIDELTVALKINLAAPREDRMIRNPLPALTLRKAEAMPEVAVVPQNVTSEGIPTLEEIMAETPVRSEADQATSRPPVQLPVYHDIFSRPGVRPKPFREWSPKELDGYNRQVHRYYEEYRQYLDDVLEHRLLLQRAIPVRLSVVNSGTLPATDVTAYIKLPAGVLAYIEGTLPIAPEPPRPPVMALHMSSALTTVHSPEISMFEPRKALTIADDHRLVEFRTGKIQHHYHQPIKSFMLLFKTAHDVKSFDAEYEITANELPYPRKDILHFEVDMRVR
jgi:hypothetical protein